MFAGVYIGVRLQHSGDLGCADFSGLCFKLGQGVAQNDKRAVAELHQACNEAFFDAGAEYILSTDIQQLPPKRKAAVLVSCLPVSLDLELIGTEGFGCVHV